MTPEDKANLRALAMAAKEGGPWLADELLGVANPATVLALLDENDRLRAEVEALRVDAGRLDWLDKLNAALNKQNGTTYRWKLVLSPNVVRLMSGNHANGFIGDIDLHDSDARGLTSCRAAIDAAMSQRG